MKISPLLLFVLLALPVTQAALADPWDDMRRAANPSYYGEKQECDHYADCAKDDKVRVDREERQREIDNSFATDRDQNRQKSISGIISNQLQLSGGR